MGLFRPARTVTGPHGEYWELYVSKTALPAWRERAPGSVEYGSVDPRGDLLELPFMLVSAVWGILIAPLLRFFVLLPVSFVRGRRSRACASKRSTAFRSAKSFSGRRPTTGSSACWTRSCRASRPGSSCSPRARSIPAGNDERVRARRRAAVRSRAGRRVGRVCADDVRRQADCRRRQIGCRRRGVCACRRVPRRCTRRRRRLAAGRAAALAHAGRSREQLVGMRDALERCARTSPTSSATRTAAARAIDAQLARVDQLWIERPPDEIRGAIGSALALGLDEAYALGCRLMTA